jgi:hypothetical protein
MIDQKLHYPTVQFMEVGGGPDDGNRARTNKALYCGGLSGIHGCGHNFIHDSFCPFRTIFGEKEQ